MSRSQSEGHHLNVKSLLSRSGCSSDQSETDIEKKDLERLQKTTTPNQPSTEQPAINRRKESRQQGSTSEEMIQIVNKEINVSSLPLFEENNMKKVTIVHMSDSHKMHKYLKDFPQGDIFIHSGDISHKSEWKRIWENNTTGEFEAAPSIVSFNEWVKQLPYAIKICILGNHDMGFNDTTSEFIQQNVLNNVIYLQDEALTINYKGKRLLKLFGTPWTTSSNMGFSMSRKEIGKKWDSIPLDTDVLVTHLPPFGVMDLAFTNSEPFFCSTCQIQHYNGRHWGDVSLRKKCIKLNERGRLKAHLFGHVHEFHEVQLEEQTGNIKNPLIYSNAASVTFHGDKNVKTPNVIEINV